MCNLYSRSRSAHEIRQLFRLDRDLVDDVPPKPSIYPDQTAPVIRLDDNGRRVMQQMRWGFPPPMGNRPVTNARNTGSRFWRSWLKPADRCLAAAGFGEYSDNRPKVPYWFAVPPGRPPFTFAGIRRSSTGLRSKQEGDPGCSPS